MNFVSTEDAKVSFISTVKFNFFRFENFFVCNYGVGGNVVGEPVYKHSDCQQTGKQREKEERHIKNKTEAAKKRKGEIESKREREQER